MNGVTDFGTPGYGGPCPPKGARPHHYHFTLYALKIEKLDVPKGATASLIGYMAKRELDRHGDAHRQIRSAR